MPASLECYAPAIYSDYYRSIHDLGSLSICLQGTDSEDDDVQGEEDDDDEEDD